MPLTLAPDRSRSPRRVALLIAAYVAVLGLLAWAALGEESPATATGFDRCFADGTDCVNPNDATTNQLSHLYRVGPVLAARIVAGARRPFDNH